ncbi:MAG TPA: oligopeptide/dipeptide ABC transporter ATP-binding protein [Methanospirillum sp.]|uniref:oligopeptide/dipeptide ABC transporter ATP-binding protein n=1 Tax=Methanospirillum sp. TaxID=45200 RepID=UPI002B71DECB|nr:oligopeptide/dipeptide ABC transporter ATP-binding protein [Methanospirillum sp.]HWQ63021.1 oligopeptide/dipeptide ABC transporter ATP-binding protein [Methanospirillum sp.]
MLELVNISKQYSSGFFRKKAILAVDSVSLSISPGETVGVVGESGSGKTTLGLIATHLVQQTSGKLFFNGTPVNSNLSDVLNLRKHIQIVFQNNESALNPRMTLEQLVVEPLVVHHLDSSNKAVSILLKRVGLGQDLLHRYPHELSGGQRQRICIARAISLHPQYIIADEPAASLDYSVQAQILELLKELQKEEGIGYLFISHHLKVIKIMADVVAVMYKGRIVEQSDTIRFFESPLHPYSQALLLSMPGYHRRNSQDTLKIRDNLHIQNSSGCPYYLRCRIKEEICSQLKPELQDRGDGHYVACHILKKSG